MEYAQRLQRLVQSARAVAQRRRHGMVRLPRRTRRIVPLRELHHGLHGQHRVFKELHAFRVAFAAAFCETRLHLAETRSESVAYRQREIRRQVEYDALLSEGSSGSSPRGHFGLRVQIGNLFHRPHKGETFTFHERGLFRLQHFLESDPGACHVARAIGDKALEERLPVHVAAELLLFLVERPL